MHLYNKIMGFSKSTKINISDHFLLSIHYFQNMIGKSMYFNTSYFQSNLTPKSRAIHEINSIDTSN